MASEQELACIYAILALQDDGVQITVEKVTKLVAAAGVTIEPFWAGLFVKALDGVNVKELVQKIGSGVGSGSSAPAGAAAPAAADAAPAKEEKKKEEPKEESEDEDMGFGLFD